MPGPNTNKKAEESLKRIRAKELRKLELETIAVKKRRLNKSYALIAKEMTDEGHGTFTKSGARRLVLNGLRDKDADKEVFDQEIDRLESAAASLLTQMQRMEEEAEGSPVGAAVIDWEVYAKLSDTYLKYRDRVAKLRGLDKGGVQGGKSVIKSNAEKQAEAVAAGGVHIHLPGSVTAFEEWNRLADLGLTKLASDVLDLDSEEPDVSVTGVHDDAAGTTLAPNADLGRTAELERAPENSLDALSLLVADRTGA